MGESFVDLLVQVGLSNALVAAVLALLAAAAGALCRRPALTHSLWLLVLLKLITPPLFSVPIPWPGSNRHEPATLASETVKPAPPAFSTPAFTEDALETPGPIDELPSVTDAQEEPAASAGLIVETPAVPELPALASAASDTGSSAVTKADGLYLGQPMLAAAWLAGSLIWAVLLLVRTGRFRQVARWARPAPEDVLARAQELAARLGLRSCPAIAFLPGHISPLLWGCGWRPQLLLPEELWQRLSPDQRATLLAHELAHLRRHDRWVRALELLTTGLYWWLPIVWWARRELREAEEQCCDAWVVSILPKVARAYATALVETLDFLAESPMTLPAAASGIGPIHDLRRRLTMIMRGTTPRSLSAAGFLLVAALGAILLPLVPTWAQQITPPNTAPPGEQQLAPDREDPTQPPAHKPMDLAQAGEDLRRLTVQAHEAQARLERTMSELRVAQQRYRDLAAERANRDRYRDLRFNSDQIAPREDLAARLDQMDRKLDAVLEELRSLRREMRRADPGRGLPGGRPGLPDSGDRLGPAGRAPAPETAPNPPSRKPDQPGAGPTPPGLPSAAGQAPPLVPVPPPPGGGAGATSAPGALTPETPKLPAAPRNVPSAAPSFPPAGQETSPAPSGSDKT